MAELPNVEQPQPEKTPKFLKTRKFFGRIALAATCALPVADLTMSDALTARVYDAAHEHVQVLKNKPLNRAVQNGAVGAALAGESIALGLVISRNKKLRDTFGEFDEYMTAKQKNMKGVRKVISKTANLPLKGFQRIGEGFENLGHKIENRKSRTARVAGRLLVDAGKVNAIGTSGVIMNETMSSNPPTLGRNARLAGLITGSWLGGAEIVSGIYNLVPGADKVLGPIGRGFVALTSPDFINPSQEPIGTLTVSALVTGLAVTGWRLGEYHRRKEEGLLNPEEIAIPTNLITENNGQFSAEHA